MLSSLRIFAAASGVFFLGACFLSENQLIGEGARLQDGPITFCIEAGEPCNQAIASEDGYFILPPPEDADEAPIFARFIPLTEIGGRQIWLGEAEIGDNGDTAWAYVVISFAGQTADGVNEYQVAVPGCSDASLEQRLKYQIESDRYGCSVTDIAAFADYLRERHGDDFDDPDWWDEN